MSEPEIIEEYLGYQAFCRFKGLPCPSQDDFEAGFRAARSATAPEWIDRPSEPGVYLTEDIRGWRSAARIGEDNGELYATIIGNEGRFTLDVFTSKMRFLGPLSFARSAPPPAPPVLLGGVTSEQMAVAMEERYRMLASEPAPPVGGGERELRKYVEALEDEIRWRTVDRDRAIERARAFQRERIGEVWYWEKDGHNALESLTCPVLIEAEQLRALLAASPPPEGRSGGAEILYTGDVGPLDCAVYDEEGRRVPPDLTFPAEPSVREWRVVGLGLKGLAGPLDAESYESARGLIETARGMLKTNPRIEYREVGPWTALPVEPAVRAEAVEADEEGAAEWEHRTGRKTDCALPRQYHETVEDWQARVAMYRNQLAPPAVRAEEEKP